MDRIGGTAASAAGMKPSKRKRRTESRMPIVEIAFHHVENSAPVEAEIRARIGDLERIYDRLTACRVRVDQRASNSNGTIPPVVRIELGIPGTKDLVVSHEPEHLQRKFQRPDLQNAINEAFRKAERQLSDLKTSRDGRTKDVHHDTPNQLLGQVAEINPDDDFGFLLTASGGLLYFHRNSMLSGDFDALNRGDGVYYIEDVGDTGPIATKVRVRNGKAS
jgi:ribosome-associated translation inhibitor RaiA/cold shock CspA family protein